LFWWLTFAPGVNVGEPTGAMIVVMQRVHEVPPKVPTNPTPNPLEGTVIEANKNCGSG
jgi:hypothetical protein